MTGGMKFPHIDCDRIILRAIEREGEVTKHTIEGSTARSGCLAKGRKDEMVLNIHFSFSVSFRIDQKQLSLH